jgi:hypothetical protein
MIESIKGQRDSIFANAVSEAVKDFAIEMGEKPGSLQEKKMHEGAFPFNK